MNYPAWQIKTADPAAEQALAGAGCGALLRRVLAARGCTDPAEVQALLGAGAELSDPFLLRDMDKAVARIEQAVENEETIVIYGDYDVDGISATAILYECLSSMGAHVRCKLPTRGTGYGLTRPALESLAEKGFKLVVTVDNGISAIEEAACAKELGLDLIVTDHHLPGETLPDAVAVVDPKRADDESPFKDLCGAGVAFKLCAALEGCEPADLLEMYGELVALGTVADVMPLVGENRTLVREGLALLQDTMRPGLQALMENAGVAGKPVTADTVSYSLAPRLNAAGRMDNAAVALKLLLCTDEAQAAGIAARLAEINTERQQTEQEVFAAAQKTLEADPARQRDRVLVVSGEDWHPGVIGIVAARLMEKYNRPAIVISLQNGEGRGSGRAPDPFDLHGALAGCAQYLTRFGGHAAAAGVEIEEEKLPAFRQAINAWAAEHAPRHGAPELKLDAAVQLSELTLPNVQELSRLAPFGRGKPHAGAAGLRRYDRWYLAYGRRGTPHPGAAAPGQRYPVCLDLRRSTVGFCLPGGHSGGSRAGSFDLYRAQRADGLGPSAGHPPRGAGQSAQRAGRLVRGVPHRRHTGTRPRRRAAARPCRHRDAVQAHPGRAGRLGRSAACVCRPRAGKHRQDPDQPGRPARTGADPGAERPLVARAGNHQAGPGQRADPAKAGSSC